MGVELEQIKKWITEHQGHHDYVLPTALASDKTAGCKVLGWHGHSVTLLCFKFNGTHVDVFVVNESALPRLPLGTIPELAPAAGLETAAWRADGKLCFGAASMTQSELQQLF